MRLVGSEVFSRGLTFAADRAPDAEFIQMDARNIPYQAEFDAIGAFDTLEHIAEDEAVLRQLEHALKPAGVLLITVPQHEFLWSATDEAAHHVRRYKSRDLRRKVRAAGLEIVRMTSFVSLLFPLMLASRWSKGGRNAELNSVELQLSPIADLCLEKILQAELFLIRNGVDFPFGGSLLLIARKPANK